MGVNKDNWKTCGINVDSLWIIPERQKSGKHANVYHGNFVPQIPFQLISRYTNEGDCVMELFSGSGTTLFECETLGRNYIGYDINPAIIEYVRSKMKETCPIAYALNECNVVNETAFEKCTQDSFAQIGCRQADFLIAHPPYMDIVKFTENAADLSQVSALDDFLEKFTQSMRNGLRHLRKGKYFAVVMGDIYKKSEVVPLAFYTMDAIKKHFKVKLKGIIVKNIEGNRGKLGAQNIWKYRALMSDYYLFKHEYVFVFKKENQNDEE